MASSATQAGSVMGYLCRLNSYGILSLAYGIVRRTLSLDDFGADIISFASRSYVDLPVIGGTHFSVAWVISETEAQPCINSKTEAQPQACDHLLIRALSTDNS